MVRILHLSIFCYLFFISIQLQAQYITLGTTSKSAYFVTESEGNPIAYYYENTASVKEQQGEWNFKLEEPNHSAIVSFNTNGQQKETIFFFSNSSLFSFSEFHYNKNGILENIKEEIQPIGTNLELKYNYKNDSNTPSSVDISLAGRAKNSHQWEKSRRGKTTEHIYSNDKKVMELDLKNFQVQSCLYYDTTGNLHAQENFIYNDHNDLQQSIKSLPNEELLQKHHFTYLYNEYGDWTKRLEHQEETGKYILTTRQIFYQDQTADFNNSNNNTGFWQSPLSGFAILLEENGQFSILDFKEDELAEGTWHENGWGQLTLTLKRNNQLAYNSRWNSRHTITAEIIDGRIKLFMNDNKYHELVHEDLLPTSGFLSGYLKYKRWDNNRWTKPGFRNPEAIPVNLRAVYSSIYPAIPGLFTVSKEDNTCGIVDSSGNIIIPIIYEHVSCALNNYYSASLNDQIGLLDSTGQIILPFEYDRIWSEPKFGYSVFGTRKNGKRYYYNADTKSFWTFEKDDLIGFNDDRWVIRTEDRLSQLTDKEFNVIETENSYRWIKILANNRYLASDNRQYWIIDKNGTTISSLAEFTAVKSAFFGYLIGTSQNKLKALIDMNGRAITSAAYTEITYCQDEKYQAGLCFELTKRGLIAHYKKPNGEQGYLDGFGNEIDE